jgi:hypothetical protein
MRPKLILDKTNINTIVGIVDTVVTVIALYSAWSGSINWPWVILIFAFLITISLIVLRWQEFQKIINALKPKPKLDIIVRDLTCYVSIESRQEDRNPRMQSPHIALDIVCTVRITNKSKAVATQVLGEMKLTVRQGENSFCCKSKRTTHTYKLAKKDKPRQERIVFERKHFPQEDFVYYPDAAYHLDYVYQCRERPKLVATCNGTLTKSDWVGQRYIPETLTNGSFITPARWVSDEDVLKLIRRLGFIDPS